MKYSGQNIHVIYNGILYNCSDDPRGWGVGGGEKMGQQCFKKSVTQNTEYVFNNISQMTGPMVCQGWGVHLYIYIYIYTKHQQTTDQSGKTFSHFKWEKFNDKMFI